MKTLFEALEQHRDEVLAAERYIWQHPETGYREEKTSAYMKAAFERLGYTLTMAEGITGFYTVLDTGRPGPELLILGELDAVICPLHPEADPTTGAVHACGHHAQCAALLGVAAALKAPHATDGLCGRIRLCAVPAEELLEIEYRSELRKQGVIKYFGGKSEFLHRGYFDGTDLAFMVHTAGSFGVRAGSVGCIAKSIVYKGKPAHAGAGPWGGINALYAANCGINAVNALRETFKEEDIIRFHPIITAGGTMVNAIPGEVRLESYVRGSSFDAIVKANKKINRALAGAALSIGGNVDITDIPGYSPLQNAPDLMQLAADAAALALPSVPFNINPKTGSGSTDMGDLCSVMPVVHPYAGGAKGTSHGMNYQIVDPEQACIDSAKMQLAMLWLLLENDAARAKSVIENYTPPFPSKEAYFAYVDELNRTGDRITYDEDGNASVNLA